MHNGSRIQRVLEAPWENQKEPSCLYFEGLLPFFYLLLHLAEFMTPVLWKEWGLLDYPKIIKHPMDLGTVEVFFSFLLYPYRRSSLAISTRMSMSSPSIWDLFGRIVWPTTLYFFGFSFSMSRMVLIFTNAQRTSPRNSKMDLLKS